MNKNVRAGFQGKKDAMSELADKLMNHSGNSKASCRASSTANKCQKKLYKKGGLVNKKNQSKKNEDNSSLVKKFNEHLEKNKQRPKGEALRKILNNSIVKKGAKILDADILNPMSENINIEVENTMKKDQSSKSTPKEYASGGVAKIRHKQATKKGGLLPPSNKKRNSLGK